MANEGNGQSYLQKTRNGVKTDQSVCVCLSLGVADVAVLDAQHNVGAGAAAGALLQQVAALQGRRHAAQRPVADAPRLAEVVDVALTLVGRPVPHHLLWPGMKHKNVLGLYILVSDLVLS